MNTGFSFLMGRAFRAPRALLPLCPQRTQPYPEGTVRHPSLGSGGGAHVNDTQLNFPVHTMPQILRQYTVTDRSAFR